MLHKLFKGNRSHIRSILSIVLCLVLIGGTFASVNVFAEEPGTELATETAVSEVPETLAGVSAVTETETAADTETVTETVTETAADTETVTETVTEAAADTETVTETVTEAATEAPTETPIEDATETLTEISTEAVTEGTTESGTEDSTETATEGTTEGVTEETTESTTEGESETTTESTTEEGTETAMPAVTLTGSYSDVDVTVYAPEGTFAKGVQMVVSEADVDAFIEAVTEELDETYVVIDAVVVNITFYDAEGSEVEPATEVEVKLSGAAVEGLNTELTVESEDADEDEDEEVITAESALLYHMDDASNAEYVEMENENPGEASYTFSAGSFSSYGIALTADWNRPGDQGSGNECDQSYYNGSVHVYYDTFSATYSGSSISGGSVNADARNYIDTVVLNSTAVVQANSNSTGWNGGSTLSTYFPNATTSNEQTTTLVITPKAGYYVTAVVVACTSGNNSTSPYNCNTWAEGNAFNESFSVGSSGAATITISSKDFSHGSNQSGQGGQSSNSNNNYFILIEVAPIPSPLYVEYYYGDIVTYIGTGDATAFDDPSKWTSTTDRNDYGSGYSDSNGDGDPGVKTNYTQYKYAYAGTADASSAANWTHFANTITDDAKAQAAAAGYVFAGWAAQYYTAVSVSDTDDAYGNDYTYTFSSSYGSASYNAGEQVALTTNVRLIAQWIPIGIQVTKTVSGLTGTSLADVEHTYTVELQKFNTTDETWTTYSSVELTVTGDGSASNYIYPLPSGTYRVVETGGNGDLTSSDETTIYYITVSDGDSIEVTYNSEYAVTSGIDESTNVALLSNGLTVTNTYSETPATIDIIVIKEVTGNMGDTTKSFGITVTEQDANSGTTFSLSDYETSEKTSYGTLSSVSIGTTLVVSENADDADGYDSTTVEYGYFDDNGDFVSTGTVTDNTLTVNSTCNVIKVTNTKTAIPDTGINLDTAPYIAILFGVMLFGTAFLIRRRRRLL